MEGDKLPSEILLRVFTHLDLRSRAAARITCHRWRDLIKCTSQPPLRLYVGSTSNFDAYPQPAYCSGENDYSAWDAYSVSEQKVVLFLVNNNRGKELFLRVHSDEVLYRCLGAIDTEWHQLENLKIEYFWGIDDDYLSLTSYTLTKCITHMEASYADSGDDFVEEIFKTCTNIESLVLRSARETYPSTFRKLPGQLRTLFVPGLNTLREEMDAFFYGNFENIQHFGFNVCDGIELLQICTKMKDLFTLSVTLADGEPPESVRPIAQLQKLRNLNFESSDKNLEVEILGVLEKCPNLRSLGVNGGFITPSFMRSLPTCVPQLRELGLFDDYIDSSYSKAMHNLPELARMVHLETLAVTVDCEYIGPVVRLVEDSPNLKNFDFATKVYSTGKVSLWETMVEKANETKVESFDLEPVVVLVVQSLFPKT